MSLVRMLPTLDDEVNVAVFHPDAGGGLAYGTKEGRLRILRLDRWVGGWVGGWDYRGVGQRGAWCTSRLVG